MVAFLVSKLYDQSSVKVTLGIINNITREKPGDSVDIFIKHDID